MRALTPALEIGDRQNQRSELHWCMVHGGVHAFTFTGTYVQYLLQAHGQINQPVWQLVIFLTTSVDVLLRGDATNRTASFGGATMSKFCLPNQALSMSTRCDM